MSNSANKKSLAHGARLVAACADVLALVVYLVYNLAIGKFTLDVFLAILAGVVFSCVALFTKFKFAPILSVLGTSLGIGFYLNDRIIMFEEMINRITGMTERNNIFAVVVVIFVLLFVSAISGIVASFGSDN